MSIICDEFEQRTAEWRIACLGNPGGSGISRILTSKGDISAQREKYLEELACERFTGKSACGDFVSEHMAHGTDSEDSSRALFELVTGIDVRQVGTVFKDERRLCHYSPDGLIGDHAILELKNPMSKTHIKYMEKKKVPTQYILQIQMGLYVCDRTVGYFMSNADGYAPVIVKVRRDEELIRKIHNAIEDFGRDLVAREQMFRDNGGMPF